MKTAPAAEFVLTLSCPDVKGIVHAVAGLLYQAGCNIIDSQQFGDLHGADATGLFFMRVHFEDFAAVGRDVECVVLARAVRWHVQHRVLINGRKTAVFR